MAERKRECCDMKLLKILKKVCDVTLSGATDDNTGQRHRTSSFQFNNVIISLVGFFFTCGERQSICA